MFHRADIKGTYRELFFIHIILITYFSRLFLFFKDCYWTRTSAKGIIICKYLWFYLIIFRCCLIWFFKYLRESLTESLLSIWVLFCSILVVKFVLVGSFYRYSSFAVKAASAVFLSLWHLAKRYSTIFWNAFNTYFASMVMFLFYFFDWSLYSDLIFWGFAERTTFIFGLIYVWVHIVYNIK